MISRYTGPLPEPIGFFLVPDYSMMAFFSAVEPLRIANRCAGEPLFRWQTITGDGEPVAASNGMRLMPDSAMEDVHDLPTVLVCAAFDVEAHAGRRVLTWLNRLDATGTVLGGMDTGAFLLARAGLLHGHRVTMHWESLPAFREAFPDIETSDELYEMDERRFSCAGGAAAMDMMLDIIAQRHGAELALAVSEQLIHARIRSRRAHQRIALAARLGIHNRRLLRAVELMERNLEQPLPPAELADRCDISLRQLQRLFAEQLDTTPSAYYQRLRLERAQQLLQQTDMTVLGVGLACGFTSASSFSRAYRAHFDRPPREDRRWLR